MRCNYLSLPLIPAFGTQIIDTTALRTLGFYSLTTGHLITSSHKISQPREMALEWSYRCEIWQISVTFCSDRIILPPFTIFDRFVNKGPVYLVSTIGPSAHLVWPPPFLSESFPLEDVLTTSAMTIKMTFFSFHYYDVIMSAMASQITSLAIVYLTLHSGAHQRKHQSSQRHWPLSVEFTGDRWITRTKGQ